MLLALTAALGFAPAPISPLSRSAVRAGRPLMATPLDAVASPLNKWAPAAAAGGSPLDGLPLEVQALFAIIPIVGVLGLLKSNGMLGDNAPTLGLGDSREDLAPEAVAAAEQAEKEADMTDAEREKMYFQQINAENKKKRGGDKSARKKKK